jgi:hypothetical protein
LALKVEEDRVTVNECPGKDRGRGNFGRISLPKEPEPRVLGVLGVVPAIGFQHELDRAVCLVQDVLAEFFL